MTRLIPIFVSFLLVCACATTDKPIASTVPSLATAAQPEPVDAAPQVPNPTHDTAEKELHMIDVPPIEQSDAPIVISNANERICRREKRTGTHRAVRVCRTRAEMTRLEEESKKTFDELRKSQMQGK